MYNVVYEGLGGKDSMPLGTRFSTEYHSIEHFETDRSDKFKVVAQGITNQEARQLCNEVSGKTLARAVLERGMNEGTINNHLLNYRLEAARLGKLGEFDAEIRNIIRCANTLASLFR